MSKAKQAGKGIGIGAIVVVVVVIGLALLGGFTSNETENWTLVQRPWDIGGGDPTIGGGKIIVENEKNPFIFKCFGTKATYPDNVTEFFSDRDDETDASGDASDKSVKVVFKEKGTASFSAQVVYETPVLMQDQLEFHKLARDNMKVVSKTVQTALNQSCRFVAANMTASEFFEGQEIVVQKINTLMKENTLLRDKWKILIVDVQISNINPDKRTLDLFAKQQEALLNAKTAEANKEKFIQQELETVAEYANNIAIEKGKADMEKMKMVTDAQREAELATIEAQRKVDVQALAKEEAEELRLKMSIDASALLEVALIAKEEAGARAEAVIITAKGEQERITLAGAITEKEKVLAEIQAKKEVMVAGEIAKQKWVPETLNIISSGGSDGGEAPATSVMQNLINMKLLAGVGLIDDAKPVVK